MDEDEIPELVKEAFVATEDRRFYEHQGVDIWSIGRAAVKDIMARSMVEGQYANPAACEKYVPVP